MNSDSPDEFSQSPASRPESPGDKTAGGSSAHSRVGSADAASPAGPTILLRGETVRAREPTSPPNESASIDTVPQPSTAKDLRYGSIGSGGKDASGGDKEVKVVVRGEPVPNQEARAAPKASPSKDKDKSPRKELSEAKVKMQKSLPALADDAEVGVQKEQVITRDGKADLAFTGTLLASAAPSSAPKGQWQEYRIYETNGGKHVFSKVTRNVIAEQPDACEAEVFDPTPSSMPSKLLRSARELTHARPLTWTDAAIDFFGYDPLAKTLYRKLGSQFEEHIS